MNHHRMEWNEWNGMESNGMEWIDHRMESNRLNGMD